MGVAEQFPSHLWHNRFPVFTLDIAEWHLSALVVVELELGKVQIGNLLESS